MDKTDIVISMKFDGNNLFILYPNPAYASKVVG